MKLSTILLLKKQRFSLNESFGLNKIFKRYNDQLSKNLSFYETFKLTDECNEKGMYSLIENYNQLKAAVISAVNNAKKSDNQSELKSLDTFDGRYKMLNYDFRFNTYFHDLVSLLRFKIPLFKSISVDKLSDADFEILTMKQFKHPGIRDQYMCFIENSKGDLLGVTFAKELLFVVLPSTKMFFYPKAQYNGPKISEIDITDKNALLYYLDNAFVYMNPYTICYSDFTRLLGTASANFFTKEVGKAKVINNSYAYEQRDNQSELLKDVATIRAIKISSLQTTKRDAKIADRSEQNFYDVITKPETYTSAITNEIETHWKLQENRYRLLSTYTKVLKEFEDTKKRLDAVIDDCSEARKSLIQSQSELLAAARKKKISLSTTETVAFSYMLGFIEQLTTYAYKVLININTLSDIDISYSSPLINDAKKVNAQNIKLYGALSALQTNLFYLNHAYDEHRTMLGNALAKFKELNDLFGLRIFDIIALTDFTLTNHWVNLPRIDLYGINNR